MKWAFDGAHLTPQYITFRVGKFENQTLWNSVVIIVDIR